MSYIQARSDLHFMQEFREAILKLWQFEDQAIERLKSHGASLSSRDPIPVERQELIQSEASKIQGYRQIREQIVKGVLRANRIASRLRVPAGLVSYPMPAMAGRMPIIDISCFDAIIRDISYQGVGRQEIYDALNQTLGECEARVALELRHLINPLYWIKELLVFIIRIPFLLVEASGFDVGKVEDHFLAKAFKLVEIAVIVYILVRLGLTQQDLKDFLIAVFSK
jgi:hypothetical protein